MPPVGSSVRASALVGLLAWELALLHAFSLTLVAPGDDINDEDSGLHGVVLGPIGLTGAADPRREGVAIVLESLP